MHVITKFCRHKYTAGIPFYDLDDREFSFAIGYWTGQFDELMTSDLYNLLPNPDTNDEADPDSMFINPYSVYQN